MLVPNQPYPYCEWPTPQLLSALIADYPSGWITSDQYQIVFHQFCGWRSIYLTWLDERMCILEVLIQVYIYIHMYTPNFSRALNARPVFCFRFLRSNPNHPFRPSSWTTWIDPRSLHGFMLWRSPWVNWNHNVQIAAWAQVFFTPLEKVVFLREFCVCFF